MNPSIRNLIYSDSADIAEKVASVEYSLISIERRLNIYRFLSMLLKNNIDGEVVELGVYTGMTAVLIQEILDEFNSPRKLSLYDSFEGLPASTYPLEKDRPGVFGSHPAGEILSIVLKNFATRNLRAPEVHKGWISREFLADHLPERICFAHLDVDMYESTRDSLEAIYPRLTKGGVVIVDDYNHPAWRGVRAAVDEFDHRQDLLFYDLNTTSHINDHQGVFIKAM